MYDNLHSFVEAKIADISGHFVISPRQHTSESSLSEDLRKNSYKYGHSSNELGLSRSVKNADQNITNNKIPLHNRACGLLLST